MRDSSSDPLISVVIPTFDSAEYVQRALASVLAQTYRNFEVIVSDDGSTDGTVDVVEEVLSQPPGVSWRLLRNPHGEAAAARNAAVLAAVGEWLAFLDSDDAWLPEKLACVADFIRSHPDAGLICHDVLWLHEHKSARVVHYHRFLKPNRDPFMALIRRNILSTSATTAKRSIVMEAGLFDPVLPPNEDYDLWLRIARRYRPLYIDKVLAQYEPRLGSVSTNHTRRLASMLAIADKHFPEVSKRACWPAYEYRRFRCRAHLSCAKGLILSRQIGQGVYLILKAIVALLSSTRRPIE